MPKISALTSLAQASVDTAADVLPIVDATAPATTKKVTVQAMVNAGLATLTTLPSGIVNASLTSVGTLTALTVSGQASFAAGSAAAPSVRVGGEQNGFYSSAANTLDVTLNGVRQFQFGYTASAVNYLQATGAATTGAPSFAVGGTDANVSFAHYTKGTGTHQFFANSGLQLLVGAPASAVNYWQFFGAATAGALNMYAGGTDTNIGVVNNSKGTGSHFFRTDAGAATQFVIAHVANAVNCLQAAGNSTGAYPSLRSIGSDTNVGFDFSTQGAAPIRFYTAAFGAEQFRVASVASAVNYLQATGSTTGNAVSMTAGGSDANIDFAITPKGTGNVRFGTHSAIAAETVTGYITIKDSAGNTRKLAVLS